MNEPKRLFQSGPERVRTLLHAGKRDAPGARTAEGVLGALGLGAGGAVAGAGALGGAAAGAKATVPSAVARSLAGLGRAAVSKVGIGVIAAATAGGAGYVAGQHGHPREAPIERTAAATSDLPLVTPGRNAPVVATSDATNGASSGPAVVAAPSTPLTRSPTSSRSAAVSARPPHDPEPPSIAAQLEGIRRVRGLVEDGDGAGALAALDAYDARTPHGTFEEEAMALRVRALRLTGDADGAARELARLQARYPRSVHLAKLAP